MVTYSIGMDWISGFLDIWYPARYQVRYSAGYYKEFMHYQKKIAKSLQVNLHLKLKTFFVKIL